MSTRVVSKRVVLAIGLAFAVLSASVTPVVGVGNTTVGVENATVVGVGNAPIDRSDAALSPTGDEFAQSSDEFAQYGDGVAQYKVSGENVTIRTWLLRNSTVINATVEQVLIRNVTTTDGSRTNVTLSNVTVGTFVLDRARLSNVTVRRLVIRNKSVLSVPGGEFIDPNVQNRTIERQWIKNATVAGVVIDRVTVDAATLCGNASLGPRANDDAAFDPRDGEEKPDVTVTNGTVEEALVMRGTVSNWSVGSVDQSAASNASLPNTCNRG